MPPPAQALYARLIAPVAEAIDAAGLQSLLVHLDGHLRYIPIAALHDGEQWLAPRWSPVYYTAVSERRTDLAEDGDWRIAGLGVSEARPGLSPLPAVAAEIDAIVPDDGDDDGVLPGQALRESDPPLDLRPIDLVALSVCNTFPGGDDETGVEIEGMGAIIQRQGVRVLASLWTVADASTGALMQRLYRLRAEPHRGLLRAAQSR